MKDLELIAKKQYDAQLSNGELFMFFPQLTGEWEQDKDTYIAEFRDVQELFTHLDDDDFDIDDDSY